VGEHAPPAQWLPGAKLTIRKATENKTLRVTWATARISKSISTRRASPRRQIAVQHGKLKSARAATQQKAFWGEAFDRLAQVLET
jgi:hypothetical protein